MVGEHVRVKGMFVHVRELDEAMSKLPQISKYQMILRLEEHRDRITLNVEAEPGVNRKEISEAVNRRCQDVFKLRMDNVEFLDKGTLAEGCKKIIDTRWG
jgi:phenylacetate-coenzyme A ligase PaaK-like adenylate-forming protein